MKVRARNVVVAIMATTFIFTIHVTTIKTSEVIDVMSTSIEEVTEADETFIFSEEVKDIESTIPFTDEELNAIALTLAGECYEEKEEDKRKVVEVILNRVSSGRFGDSILDVVSAKGQFLGYWNQGRPISDSDIKIAEETLIDWYNNDKAPLSDYLYFCTGPNRENIFRVSY